MVRRSSCSNNNNNNNSYDGSNVCDVTGSFFGGEVSGWTRREERAGRKRKRRKQCFGGFFTLQSLALARAPPPVVGEKNIPFLTHSLSPLQSSSQKTPVSSLI